MGRTMTEEKMLIEEIGEMVGWGTVIAMGAAGVLFPIRKSAKWILTNYPEVEKYFYSLSKFFREISFVDWNNCFSFKSISWNCYVSKRRRLEREGIIGIAALIFMVIAAIFGTVLFKNKKVKSLRTTHTILITFTLIIGFVHIITS